MFALQFPPQAYEGHITKSYHAKKICISYACLFSCGESPGKEAIGSILSPRIAGLISPVTESNILDR